MSSERQTHGSFVDVGGARLYLEAWDDAEEPTPAPALLCLHGLGGGTHFFGALGAALAGQCRTIAIDLPGSGLSPLKGAGARARVDADGTSDGAAAADADAAGASSVIDSFSFDAVADLVVSLARGEHAGGRPIRPLRLLGHSMGTILAIEVIRRAPDLVAGLIIVGGLPEPLSGARARISGRADTIRQRGIAGLGAEVVAANFSRRSQAERPELTACFAKLFDRQDPVAYAATADALARWTVRELPPLDDVPCLVITGEEDRYAPPDAVRAFARTLPAGTRIEIMRDCGHLPFLEQPAAFAAIVKSFLLG
jgi:3-oxoadipate enol-lactonase